MDDPTQDENRHEPPPAVVGIPRVYSNLAAARGGVWDLAIDFGYVVPGAEQADVEWGTRVVMSWPHAKALLTILQSNIDGYERQVGEIAMPERDSEEAGDRP